MKYKLRKDLPGITAGAEFIEHEDTETFSRLAHSYIPCVGPEFAKAHPDFFEPIKEKKTYDDLKGGDICYQLNQFGEIVSLPFAEGICRSETFITREEAEDEHKRREWTCRKDKFIPKENEGYYFPDENGDIFNTRNDKCDFDFFLINSGLAFRTREECEKAIKEHDLVRLFYTIR